MPLDLPFEPLRRTLYGPRELFAGFDAQAPPSYADTLDFRVYRRFVAGGRGAQAPYFEAMMQALHDQAMASAVAEVLRGRRCVAMMGGHALPRSSAVYAQVAGIARELTRAGFLMASGGGPGAMEATHLGAALATADGQALTAAIDELATASVLPDVSGVVAADGSVRPALVQAAHAWLAPAHRIALSLADPGESLSVPTWHYGHEPSTPLATHIAKFFQNSVREDGLLAIAQHGVIYAAGRAGTLQEIFQDAAQNYYRSFGWFSPMVLLGVEQWTRTLPVEPLLRALFAPDDFARYVLLTDDPAEAVAFIVGFEVGV